MEYPQAHWRLEGRAVCLLQLLDVSRVASSVPSELSIVSLFPGKTLGGIYLAEYGARSVLAYHELIVISALIRYGHKLGAWISHIYVDDPRSVAGGREIWGLPKQLAEFTWDEPLGPVVVRQGEQHLCTLRSTRQLPLVRLPVFVPALSRKGEDLVWFRGTGTARPALIRGELDVPSTSPFSFLGFNRGLGIYLHSLEVLVHPPVHVTKR